MTILGAAATWSIVAIIVALLLGRLIASVKNKDE